MSFSSYSSLLTSSTELQFFRNIFLKLQFLSNVFLKLQFLGNVFLKLQFLGNVFLKLHFLCNVFLEVTISLVRSSSKLKFLDKVMFLDKLCSCKHFFRNLRYLCYIFFKFPYSMEKTEDTLTVIFILVSNIIYIKLPVYG